MTKRNGRKRSKPGMARTRAYGSRARSARLLESALGRRDELLLDAWSDVMDVLPAELRHAKVVEPQEASQLLSVARVALEGLGATYSQAMGRYAWLFGLRRVPDDLIAGRLVRAGAYHRRLAETISAMSTVPEYFPEPRSVQHRVPEMSQASADALVRMCGLAENLSMVHAALRRANKGQRVELRRDDLPWVVPDPDLDTAIELYDQRVDCDSGLPSGTKILRSIPFFGPLESAVSLRDCLLYVETLEARQRVPAWRGPLGRSPKIKLREGRYFVQAVTIEISALFESAKFAGSWSPSRLSSVVLLLRVLFMFAYEADLDIGTSLSTVGYLMLPARTLKDLLAHGITAVSEKELYLGPIGLPESANRAFGELSEEVPCLWPLMPGPVVRQAGDMCLVDVSSASSLLHELLTIKNHESADLRNARGEHFELHTQDVIDLSPWRPPDSLRKYRGRTLRLGGRAITDIDALATVADVAVLISCKSILHTHESDAGEYKSVRNVKSLLEESDAKWSSVIEALRRAPVGDNYDFSGYKLVGLVCTPHVEFVDTPQARDVFTPDMAGNRIRAVASLSEIMSFIRNNAQHAEIVGL
ncbi:hypothetical protein [Nocardia cyriacigeorgica]|uniref:hypothetical protein n=1 Tax=Nocardia cyriacigeorgica TaxID=135487 RepID=UPI0018936A19|nr:hypothetical protein [Nocardia cyriacigeorgica]MBF6090757.1 hypothetical protein [Nocardia cyriacigeorgica]